MENKILIIEDDQMLRESTADFLEEEGYVIYQAENGLEGIHKAFETPPDLILCDIAMPKLDGYQVYSTLQENRVTSAIPFIYLTAKTEKEDLRTGMQLGADDYITKPFDYNELITAIHTRIEKYKKLLNTYQENFQAIIDNDMVGIFMLNEAQIIFHNKKLEKILGYSGKELGNKNFFELVHPEDLKHVQTNLRKGEKGIIQKLNLSFRIQTASQQYTKVEISAGIAELKAGKSFLGMLKESNDKANTDDPFNPNSFEHLYRSIDIVLRKKDTITGEMSQKLQEAFGGIKEINIPQNLEKLTKREIEILRLICKGMTNQQIAEQLFISRRTVDTHRSKLLEKTGSKNTAQLIMYAIKNKIIELE